MAVRKKFVRGSTTSKPATAKNAIRPAAKKQRRPGKTKGGDPYAASVPTIAEIEQAPELLAGTGRGNPGCPTLRVNVRKRPAYVIVTEGENGAIRATVRGIDVTGILRFIGRSGYKWQAAATWLSTIAVPLRRNTIVSQVSAGSGYDPKRWGDKETLRGPIPDVDPATVREIKVATKIDPPQYEFEQV